MNAAVSRSNDNLLSHRLTLNLYGKDNICFVISFRELFRLQCTQPFMINIITKYINLLKISYHCQILLSPFICLRQINSPLIHSSSHIFAGSLNMSFSCVHSLSESNFPVDSYKFLISFFRNDSTVQVFRPR